MLIVDLDGTPSQQCKQNWREYKLLMGRGGEGLAGGKFLP